MSESNEKKLDATGLFCPEPVFRTKIELERMQVGEIISVSADDLMLKKIFLDGLLEMVMS